MDWLRRRNELRAREPDTGFDVGLENEWRELYAEGVKLNMPDDVMGFRVRNNGDIEWL